MAKLSRAWIAFATAALVFGAVPAHAQGHHGGHGGDHWAGHGWHGQHGGWGPGPFWGAFGLGIGLGTYYDYYGYYGWPESPAYAVISPPPVVVDGYAPAPAAPAAPAAARTVEPVVYPRNGQNAEQTAADRQACDQWAATQQRASADRSVFSRAEWACMDGRGYTLR